jgi:copper chaperone CopZ
MFQSQRTFTHSLTALAVVAIVAVVATAPASDAVAAVQQIVLRVDGLSCPFCAYSLEKKLAEVPGISSLSIDVAEGTATASPTGDAAIEWEQLPLAVEAAGFTPRELTVSGQGMVQVDGDARKIADLDGTPLFDMEASPLTDDLEADNTPVEFEGTVLVDPKNSTTLPLLAPTKLEPVARGK